MTAAQSSLDDAPEIPGGKPGDARLRFPCAQAQQRFWFEEQLNPRNPGLNVAVRWRLDGHVSAQDIEWSWQHLVARHQTLRTFFEVSAQGDPVQVVEPHLTFTVATIDLRGVPDVDIRAEQLAQSEAKKPFDLSIAPLIRVTTLRVQDERCIVLVTAHHTVCDGWSIGILAREMGALCAARQSRKVPELPSLPITYGEFAALEQSALQDANFTAELTYSRELLAGFKQFELLPDRPRPSVQSSNGDIATVLLPRALTDGFAQLARTSGCTLFMAALAALVTLLHRYSGETDITLGSQVVGRDDVDLEDLVGCFINTIALRNDVAGDPTFSDFLERTSSMVMDTLEMRRLPLERLIEIANPKRDPSRNPLFSINFIFQRSFIKNQKYPTFELIDLPSRSAGALYDLNFFMVERPEGWRVSCEFNTDLYERASVEQLLTHYEQIIAAVVSDPTCALSRIPMLTQSERDELVHAYNATDIHGATDVTVPELVAAQARRNGDRIALVCGSRTVTYGELEMASNQLAAVLRARGLAAQARVGVFLDRSPELVIALLAVLRAGCAYVPLDPTYPSDRLTFIEADAQLAAIITRSALAPGLSQTGSTPVFIDDPTVFEAPQKPAGLPTIGPNDTAYIMYTSGSTGAPKGVAIAHRSLSNFLTAMQGRPGLSDRDVLVAVTTISFDIAGLELFLPLVTGARLILAREHETIDGQALQALLGRHHATVMQATPVTWRLLIESGWKGDPQLRMLCGGEALSRSLATELLARGSQLWNMYGPTETTIWSAALAVSQEAGPVYLGGPIANTQFYVLDAHLELAPKGVPGELFIGGDGVAQGYFNRPDLTRERFIPDPFGGTSATLYRSGDIVRWRGRDRLEFLGRTDQQVKLRGFRIELGEIESALLREPDILQAVAVVGDDAAGERALWAYVVRRPNSELDEATWTAALRARISAFLPKYMLPSPIVVMEELPRTPNGKLDRSALPHPRLNQPESPLSEPPRTPTEVVVERFVAELLGRANVGRHDDIFALGFHSLLAVRLVARIESTWSIKLALRALFDRPTVYAISAHLDDHAQGQPASQTPVIAMINRNGPRTPFIYFHSDVLSDGLYCRRITPLTGPAQPFYCVAPHGTAGLPHLNSIEAMARDYLARIFEVQPHGPYQLGGFCAGGLVAFEVAQLLRAQGLRVERLVLINASAPAQRNVLAGDRLIRALGHNRRLHPRLRESLCYHTVRLHAALGTGPRATLGFVSRLVRPLFSRAAPLPDAMDMLDPKPFEKRSGSLETENYFRQLTSALTYHPQPYDGRVTLIWGMDQPPDVGDPSLEWARLAREVEVRPMSGGHVSPLHDRIEELGHVLDDILR